ncbi:MAG: hypothetical protein WC365_08795 [Candidatus Babeliales bacterium]|jgi:hypothetical protein
MTQQPLTTMKIAELEKFKDTFDKIIVDNYAQIRTAKTKKQKIELINQYNQLTRMQNELISLENKLYFEFRDNAKYNLTTKDTIDPCFISMVAKKIKLPNGIEV